MALYRVGEVVLSKALKQKGSVKNLVFASKYRNVKELYALVCETLKYSEVLDEIFVSSKFFKHCKGLSKPLAKLLVYDFLFGKGIQCSGKYKRAVMANKSSLQSTLARIKMKKKIITNAELITDPIANVKIPKYLRVNTLKTTLKSVTNCLKSEGYNLFEGNWKKMGIKEFKIDEHIDNLLVFNDKVNFHKHDLYLNGHLIFQDKASCIPAQVLNPQSNQTVIDACAAPGNKTSHLSSLMNNTGTIYAFDLDLKRIRTMKTLLDRAGVANCEVTQSNFLHVKKDDLKYKDVRYILVDPSCSGSGMVQRLSHLTDNAESSSDKRLSSLSKFQLQVLNHALSFPQVERVAYSTCSIHDIENEDVVKQALANNSKFKLVKCLPTWTRRGHALKGFTDEAEMCVRCQPELDGTNGFFIALFERTQSSVICPAEHVQAKLIRPRKRKPRKSNGKTDSNKIKV
ncbi:28S rRNA (cytosine-C(5))-methyltransferase-like [Clavelina lepadiformis]|uniref:SAM-dependent MTase RsmB/NOP-type domain-containing protein n=1 Tax=Clavelina lepadiformis TaxID=159417 RepID=A0ABP0FL01_CLALP